MKDISALTKGPPRGISLHLPWEDPVRKRLAEAPPGPTRRASGLQTMRSERQLSVSRPACAFMLLL